MRPLAALSAAALTFVLLAASGPVHAQRKASAIDWGSANKELTRALITNDIGALAKATLHAPAPQTPRAWLYRLALLTRADYRDQALALLKTRPAFLDPQTEWGLSGPIYEAGNFDNLPLARRLSELFPETATMNPWLRRWETTAPAAEVDRWLAQRGDAGGDAWFLERLRFRGQSGTEGELLAPLEKALRERPDDTDRLARYLKAARATDRPRKLGWLADILKPERAARSYLLAAHFDLPPSVKIALFERSLGQPFTGDDASLYAEYLRQHPPAYHTIGERAALTEVQLRSWTRWALLSLYKGDNQPQKAQAMLEALAKEAPVAGELSGQIQADSGARVIEAQIRAEEPQKQDSAEYWLQRGQYYTGRREEAPAREALDHALALAPIPAPGQPSIRYQIVQAYARLLWMRDIDHPKDAYDFLRGQLALSKEYTYLDDVIVEEMLSYSHSYVDPDDPLLWAHLAALPEWRYHGQLLLQRLVAAAPAERRGAQWARAKRLIVGDDLPRRWVLARARRNIQDWPGAARAYHALLGRLHEPAERTMALTDLWEIYQQQSDLPGLQKVFAELRTRGGWDSNLAPPYFTMAVAAGQSGAKAEAARYFRLWSNQDRRLAPSFYPLPSLGIIAEIRSLYRNLERDEPQCATPARALAMVGRGD